MPGDMLARPRQPINPMEAAPTDCLIVFTTVATADEADGVAAGLVNAGLAACVSQIPQVRSVYRWEGKVERSEEVLLMIKTTEDAFANLTAELKRLHSYELPEVLAVPVERGSTDYLDWIRESMGSKE